HSFCTSLFPSFLFTSSAPSYFYPLSLHDALPILLHPVAIVRLREEDVSLLQVPPDDRLGPGLLMGGGDIGDDGAGVVDLAHEKRSEEHTSELQSRFDLVCRLLLEKKNI